jgi:protein gp37
MGGKGGAYEGLVTIGKQGPRWTGKGRLVPDLLDQPLGWKKPRKIFVNSMSDLFFEEFSNEEIAAVFGVMAACPQHTFQVLTKRTKRMRAWFEWLETAHDEHPLAILVSWAARHVSRNHVIDVLTPWPLNNIWLGVSVEDQQRADERIPELLQTPAAVRFVSYEPALEVVDFSRWLTTREPIERFEAFTPEAKAAYPIAPKELVRRGIDWVIVGGESGPRARPFAVSWARSVIAQCKAADVACFIKQLGRVTYFDLSPAPGWGPMLHVDSHGGDWSVWAPDLRVRQFPEVRP